MTYGYSHVSFVFQWEKSKATDMHLSDTSGTVLFRRLPPPVRFLINMPTAPSVMFTATWCSLSYINAKEIEQIFSVNENKSGDIALCEHSLFCTFLYLIGHRSLGLARYTINKKPYYNL